MAPAIVTDGFNLVVALICCGVAAWASWRMATYWRPARPRRWPPRRRR